MYFCLNKTQVMIRPLNPNFFSKLKINLSNSGRFNFAILFLAFSTLSTPNHTLRYDSSSSTILDADTTDDIPYEIVRPHQFSKSFEIQNSSISYNCLRKNLIVSSAQSIDQKDGIQQINENVDTSSLKDITDIIIAQTSRVNHFVEQIFRSFPSTHRYFIINYIATKDCISINIAHFKFLKTVHSQKDFVVKCALNDLHCKLFVFYNSRAKNSCFSKVFSVRPPPLV